MTNEKKPNTTADLDRAMRRCGHVHHDEHGDEVLTARLIDVLRENEKVCREEGKPFNGLRLCLKSEVTDDSDYPPWETQPHQVIEITPDHPKYTTSKDVLERLRRKIQKHMDRSRLS